MANVAVSPETLWALSIIVSEGLSAYDKPGILNKFCGLDIVSSTSLKPDQVFVFDPTNVRIGCDGLTATKVLEAKRLMASATPVWDHHNYLTFAEEKLAMKVIDWKKPIEYVPNPSIPVRYLGQYLNDHHAVATMQGDRIISVHNVDSYGGNPAINSAFRNKVVRTTRYVLVLNGRPDNHKLNSVAGFPSREAAERYRNNLQPGNSWSDAAIVEITWEE